MDYSFSKKNLDDCLLNNDFYKDTALKDTGYREKVVDTSYIRASGDFVPAIVTIKVNGKEAYVYKDMHDKLIFRKCAKNIKHYFSINPKHRNRIIKELRELLSEGTPYRIYRLDISKFFESCDIHEIVDMLQKTNLPSATIRHISSFLTCFDLFYGGGLPRGLEISSVLSEVYLKEFDRIISDSENVFYYSRYVDDIIIVTSSLEDEKQFLKHIRNVLPTSLNLNHNKQRVICIPRRSVGTHNPLKADFDYLGYNFKVIDTNLTLLNSKVPSSLKITENRKVELNLSKNKANKLKSKIAKSLYAFDKNNDYKLLHDRIEFLVTNRDIIDKNSNKRVSTGLYYSNPMLSPPFHSLREVDKYFRHLLLHSSSRLSTKINGKLSKEQVNQLLKFNFRKGFENKVFKRYSPNRLNKMAKIWQ
jgi:hypothetical protein